MATCTKIVSLYTATGTASNSTHTLNQVLVPDTTTAINACNAVLVNASEYAQLSHGFITTADDAQTIAFSLVVLLVIGFGIKAIRHALNTYDNSIDEKH